MGKNQSAAMAGKIPKSSDIDAANIKKATVQQLSAEHQKALDDIQKKIREEKEKEIQKLEEEAMKQFVKGRSHRMPPSMLPSLRYNSMRTNSLLLLQK